MKYIYYLCLIMAVPFSSCSTFEREEENMLEVIDQNAPIDMCARLIPFDDTASVNTRTTILSWKEGDVIYLLFPSADGKTTKGTASYQSGNWIVSYDKPLKRDAVTTCEAYYFDGKCSVNETDVLLKPTIGIYADHNASYNYPTGGNLSITCNLKPQTSRIRFKGKSGTSFSLTGLSCGSSFTLSSSNLSKSQPTTQITIQSNGYSPYIYGNFADASDPKLIVKQDDYSFTAECKGLGMLITGESGYMTLPTTTTHNGWEMKDFDKKKTFTAGGVAFTMILVEHGTFQMGKSADNSDETPVHSVTISKDYYIGETEVTQALWKAVTGYSPTSIGSSWSSPYGVGDNYPAYYINYEDVQSFITKINQMTGQKFRMPTEAEWEYAAKGGSKSQGYIYSGSNTIGDVAWYTLNAKKIGSSSPDYGMHMVKTKAPNELGIYDMSGNVWEWCSDWYGSYGSDTVTDPTGATSGSGRVFRGGDWGSDAADCRSVVRCYSTPMLSFTGLGFRLAL